jgi:hypothetical protein
MIHLQKNKEAFLHVETDKLSTAKMRSVRVSNIFSDNGFLITRPETIALIAVNRLPAQNPDSCWPDHALALVYYMHN